MGTSSSVALARHGQTAYNAQRRFQGHLPVGLDDTGREQAQALAQVAGRRQWAALWCSPLARARETAEVVAASVGLEPLQDDRFAETDCGEWTDRTFDEVALEDPDGFAAFVRADPGFRFPGGESFAEQALRVAAGLRDVRAGDLPALVVCHRGVIRLALFAATGDETRRAEPIPNAALVELPVPADEASPLAGEFGGLV